MMSNKELEEQLARSLRQSRNMIAHARIDELKRFLNFQKSHNPRGGISRQIVINDLEDRISELEQLNKAPKIEKEVIQND